MNPYVHQSEQIKKALSLPDEERKRIVTRLAVAEGTNSFLWTLAGWGGVLGALHYNGYLTKFPVMRSAGPRTLALITPPVIVFTFVSEQVTTRLARPEAFAYALQEKQASQLPPHQRLANFFYYNPYKIMMGVGVGGVAGLYYQASKNPELSVSQRVLHTRVMAQFSVLVSLAGLMFFKDVMDKRGPFLEPWEEAALIAQQQEYQQKMQQKQQHSQQPH